MIRMGVSMVRISLLAAALVILAACAPDVVNHNNGAWLVTQRAGEVDYELGGQVLFPFDSADLSPRAYDIVATVAADAKKHARARIEVEGFTDTSGTHDNNMVLSQARTEQVADVLVRHGIRPAGITARAMARPGRQSGLAMACANRATAVW